jgi:ribonuclease HI
MEKPYVELYTDGACSPNPGLGGWGAILVSPAHGKELALSGSERNTTNNRMELKAVIKGLEALKKPSRVRVTTDSQYVHNAFEKGWLKKWQKNGWRTADKKPVQNEDLWRELLELAKTHDLEWEWVRGHAEHVFNNRADELAVAARLKLASG